MISLQSIVDDPVVLSAANFFGVSNSEADDKECSSSWEDKQIISVGLER